MIALIFALTFQNVTATAVADRTAVRLSDSIRLTLTVEGPSPLAVTAPDEWLTAESSANWRARPTGPATVMPLADGHERWTLTLRLDPYTTGDPVPLSLNAVSVRSGTAATVESKEWPVPAIRVTSELADVSAEGARPVTGIETVPGPEGFRIQRIGIGLVVALIVTAGWTIRQRRRRETIDSQIDFKARQIAALETETDRREISRLASEALRNLVRTNYRIDLDCQTASEANQILRTTTTIPDSFDRAEYTSLLELCDRVQFDPAANENVNELKARTLAWLRAD